MTGTYDLATLKTHEPEKIQLNLIYFWAYVEAGLAGLLHLLHIPITGFVAGGFSIIVNVLLAHYGNNKANVLLKALGIVLAVKFVLSPFTPVGAYVAVCFQGLLAAFIFPVFKVNRLSIFIFSMLVMLESALQRPLIAFLIFGKQFFVSAMAMVRATFKISTADAQFTLNLLFIIYLFVYVMWAFLIYLWANYLRHRLEDNVLTTSQRALINRFKQIKPSAAAPHKAKVPVIFILCITFALLIFPFIVHQLTWFYLLRLGIILILVLFVFPYFIKTHQKFLVRKHQHIIEEIKLKLPAIRQKTTIAWELAKDYAWYKRVRYFIFYTIWLNIFEHDE